MRFKRNIFLFIVLTILPTTIAAIEIGPKKVTISEAYSYTNDYLVAENGELGLAFGDANIAVLGLTNNKIDVIQETVLTDLLLSQSKVVKGLLSPDENLLYVVVENHPSLVFSFDNEHGKLDYIRLGPELSKNAIFSPKNSYLYDASTSADLDFDESVINTNIFVVSAESDELVSNQKHNFGYFDHDLAENNRIVEITVIGDGDYLSTRVRNLTNEIFKTQLYKISGQQLEYLGNFSSFDYIESGSYFNNVYFYSDFYNGKNLVLNAVSSGATESDVNTIFFDVSGTAPVEVYRANGSCRLLEEKFNPENNFLCFNRDTNDNFILKIGEDNSFTIDSDDQRIEDYKTNLKTYSLSEQLVNYKNPVINESPKILARTPGGDQLVLLNRDERNNVSELDTGLEPKVSNPSIRQLSGFFTAPSNYKYSEPFEHILLNGSQNSVLTVNPNNGSFVFNEAPDELKSARFELINFVSPNTLYSFDRGTLSFYKVEDDIVSSIATFDLALVLPEGYQFYNGSEAVSMDNSALVFSASKRTSDNYFAEYSVFVLPFSLSADKVEIDNPTIIETYDDHWGHIYTAPNEQKFWLRLRDITYVYTLDSASGSWQRAVDILPLTDYAYTQRKEGRWWSPIYLQDNMLTLYDQENEFREQTLDSNSFLILDNQWLISSSKDSVITIYRLINEDWTPYYSFPISSIDSIDAIDNYSVLFTSLNHFFVYGEKGHQGKLFSVNWHFSAPTTLADEVSMDAGLTARVNVLENDTFTDNPIDPDSLKLLNVPSNFNVNSDDGSLTLTITDSQTGQFEFQYLIADTYGNYAEATTVKVEVTESTGENGSNRSNNSRASGGALQLWILPLILLTFPLRVVTKKTRMMRR